MFKTYSIASTGLDGFVPHTYHKLSHIIIGLLSSLVNVNTLIFFSLDITIIIIPLFLLSFIFASNEANIYFANNFNFSLNDKNKIGYWLIIFTLFALPIPVNFLVEKYSYVQSQSYSVALIFGFIFIGIFFSYINSTDNFLEKFQKEKILFKIFFFFMLFILISASFFSKISFLYIFNILGLFFYLRMKLYKFIFINVSVFFWIIFMFLLYRYWIIHFPFTVYATDFDFKILFNHLLIREFNFFEELTFIYFSFLYIFMKIIVYKKHLKLSFFENLKRKNFIDIEVLIILIFSLYIINYEYFKGIQIYLSCVK